LKNGDLLQRGAVRVQRSWYKGDINPTKTDEIREVGAGAENFERLITWIATLPEGNDEGWVFPSERVVTPLLPDNVLRRCVRPLGAAGTRLDQLRGPARIALHSA
jgi:hypothetical protein